MRKPRRGFAILCAVIALSGCEPRQPPSPEVLARWRHDSLQYEREIAKWLRDSIIVDSLADHVTVDSIAVLLRLQDHAEADAIMTAQALICEQSRLMARYSSRVSQVAIRKMQSRIWPTQQKKDAAMKRFNARLPSSFVLETGSVCGPRPEWLKSDTIAGAFVGYEPHRPYAPRRPF